MYPVNKPTHKEATMPFQSTTTTSFFRTLFERGRSAWKVPGRPVALLVTAAMAFLFGGCGGTDDGEATTQSRAALVQNWLELWNGDYSKADGIVSARFRLHAPLLGGAPDTVINTPAALVAWIRQTRAIVPDLKFVIQVGPIEQGAYSSVRWVASGTYGGGMPGAKAAPGARVEFAGADFLRIADGKIAEYWLSSDVTVFLAQLGLGG